MENIIKNPELPRTLELTNNLDSPPSDEDPNCNQLLVDASASPTLQKVYKDEYGIAVLATGKVKALAEQINHRFSPLKIAPITPHITILQGKFEPHHLPTIKAKLENYTKTLTPFKIQMASNIVAVEDNTFWDVARNSDSWSLFNQINTFMCEHPDGIPHPVGLTKQTERETRDPNNNIEHLQKYGRYGNIPGHNRPHITVVYGAQDPTLNHKINEWLSHQGELSFIAEGIALVHIDDVGNIYTVVDYFKLGGA